MTTYERVRDGRVVERVQPLAGDYEDTRLGLLALDETSEWRTAGTEKPAAADGPTGTAESSTPAPDEPEQSAQTKPRSRGRTPRE